MIHDVKIRRHFADAVECGDKTFEVRFNDRGYQRGDWLRFRVIEPGTGETIKDITDHPLYGEERRITYVMSGNGISPGYVVLGLGKPV